MSKSEGSTIQIKEIKMIQILIEFDELIQWEKFTFKVNSSL